MLVHQRVPVQIYPVGMSSVPPLVAPSAARATCAGTRAGAFVLQMFRAVVFWYVTAAKTEVYSWEDWDITLLVNQRNYGKSPCYSWVNPLFQWPFSIAFCMFTRG